MGIYNDTVTNCERAFAQELHPVELLAGFLYRWLFASLPRRAAADLAAAQSEASPGTLLLFGKARGVGEAELANPY